MRIAELFSAHATSAKFIDQGAACQAMINHASDRLTIVVCQ
jgi:hypothetical protein